MTRLALASILTITALGAPPAAAQTVVDKGPVEAIASGALRTVWAVTVTKATADAPGTSMLRTLDESGAPVDLVIAPVQSLVNLTIGHGPGGNATAVYGGCRPDCGFFAYDLEARRERELTIPLGPDNCANIAPRYDSGRVYFVRVGPRRCRPGLYELRGRRSIRRLAASDLATLSLDGGRIAYARLNPRDDQEAQVVLHRLGARRGRVVYRDSSPGSGCDVSLRPTVTGLRLLVGVQTACEGGRSAMVVRIDARRRALRCSSLSLPADEAERVLDFAFPTPRLLYRRERANERSAELVAVDAPAFGAARSC